MNTKYTSINDFIRNASESKKQQFFEKVIHKALIEQRALLNKAESIKNE